MSSLPINCVKLGTVRVGGDNPVRLMGILNTSPESFYKESVSKTKHSIINAVRQMEQEGADIIDVGGMSTAPYLDTMIPQRLESERVTRAIRIIQNISNLPISVDTCRSGVARHAMDMGVDILNDISGLKYDPVMTDVLETYSPSVILCAYDKCVSRGHPVVQAKYLLKKSITMAKQSGIGAGNIVLDPSIGFFRRSGRGGMFTRITTDWFERDHMIIQNLGTIKQGYPLMVSVSNKSFVGRLLDIGDPSDRASGSAIIEAICVLNGADVIRTHNVAQTRQAVTAAGMILKNARPARLRVQ